MYIITILTIVDIIYKVLTPQHCLWGKHTVCAKTSHPTLTFELDVIGIASNYISRTVECVIFQSWTKHAVDQPFPPLESYGQLIPLLVSDTQSDIWQIDLWTPVVVVLGSHTGEKVPTDSWFWWRQAGIGWRGWATAPFSTSPIVQGGTSAYNCCHTTRT